MQNNFDDFGKGKPVVLIHAFPFSNKMWKPQIEALSSQGFRVILPNLPGFGETSTSIIDLTIDDMANSVVEVLDLIKIERAIIGGLSMGGYVALNLYQRFAERFAALILCDTTSLPDSQEKRHSRFELIKKIEKKGTRVLIEEMLPNLISTYTKQNNPELIELLKKDIDEANPQTVIAALKGMAGRSDMSDVLSRISVPTTLIFGQQDKITDINYAQIMHQKISKSNLFIIDKAGHLSNLEQPKQFNEVLIDFCQKVNY